VSREKGGRQKGIIWSKPGGESLSHRRRNRSSWGEKRMGKGIWTYPLCGRSIIESGGKGGAYQRQNKKTSLVLKRSEQGEKMNRGEKSQP